MTIVEAIKKIMEMSVRPISAREAYEKIVENRFYIFQAKDPQHVVLMQIRRHCIDLDFPTASSIKHFRMHDDNKYSALSAPTKVLMEHSQKIHVKKTVQGKSEGRSEYTKLAGIEKELWSMHRRYLLSFKQKMLQELKRMPPSAFEAFGRELLDAYGFENTMVTTQSRDGGIDGYGRLKVTSLYTSRWLTPLA